MRWIVGASALIALSAAITAYSVNEFLKATGPGSGEIVITIDRGQSLKAVSSSLLAYGVIKNEKLFELEARAMDRERPIRAGEYLIKQGASIRDIVRQLKRGRSVLHKLTIPEGLTVQSVAIEVEKAGMASVREFTEAVSRIAVGNSWPVPSKSLEGYLFPDTYYFRRGAPAVEVAGKMVKTFFEKVSGSLPREVVADRRRLHEIVTLASIIEKETGAARERPLIAAVFKNRLERKMLLQSDPTVIYGLPEFDGNIRKVDLSYDSPYNTHTGIQVCRPAPIANPGLDSMIAVIYPAEVDYLYFVSKNNGKHHFSSNLRDHNRAVRIYQLGPKSRSRIK